MICVTGSHTRCVVLAGRLCLTMHTRCSLVNTSNFCTPPSFSITTRLYIITSRKMPIKKYKPNQKNTGSGDVVILSSTSRYTARGLVEKKTVSQHTSMASSPEKSPSKSPQKPTGGLNFDKAMLEPLKLPQSKVGLNSTACVRNWEAEPGHNLPTLIFPVTKRLYQGIHQR
jgi:hypothetical protein